MLDFSSLTSSREQQFEARFSLAPSLSLWLVLHCREAVIIESTVAEEHGRAEHLLAWEDSPQRHSPSSMLLGGYIHSYALNLRPHIVGNVQPRAMSSDHFVVVFETVSRMALNLGSFCLSLPVFRPELWGPATSKRLRNPHSVSPNDYAN